MRRKASRAAARLTSRPSGTGVVEAHMSVPRALRSAGGEPLRPAESVQMFTFAVHPPVRPWSPRSQGFPRDAASARTAAPRRHGVTSAAAQRRLRSTEWSPRISRAGSSGATAQSGRCRATSRTNSTAISKRQKRQKKGKSDRHRLLPQTEPARAAAAADRSHSCQPPNLGKIATCLFLVAGTISVNLPIFGGWHHFRIRWHRPFSPKPRCREKHQLLLLGRRERNGRGLDISKRSHSVKRRPLESDLQKPPDRMSPAQK